MKAYRTLLIALILLAFLLGFSYSPARSAPAIGSIPRFSTNSIGFVGRYNLVSSKLAIRDNLLFSGYTHFAITDISNPEQIKILDRLYNTHYIYDFVVDGQYVYTGMQDFGVYNLDILVNTISEFTPVNLKSSVTGLSLSERVLFAANGWNGVRMLDAARPADLNELGRIKVPGYTVGVTAVGQTVYVASGYDGVRIYDVSDRKNPLELAAINTPGYANNITVENTLAFVADGYAGVRILDVKDPKNAKEIGFYDTPGTAQRIIARSPYLYVADGEGGLSILSVEVPSAPARLANINASGNAVDLALKDNLIFVASMPNGIQVFSWSPPVMGSGLEQGGTLESSADRVTYTFPAGSAAAGTTLTHQPLYPSAVPDGDIEHAKVGPFFRLSAKTTGLLDSDLGAPVKVSAVYDPGKVSAQREAALGLYSWDGSAWNLLPDSKVDPQAKTVSATLRHVGLYGVFLNRSTPIKKQ